jgi:hypothetical protein
MIHQKLKSIRVHKATNRVYYMEKANNDTRDYKNGQCLIPDFLHYASGSIYQFSNKKLKSIIQDYQKELTLSGYDANDVWWSVEQEGIDALNEQIRSIFWRYCDKINNINNFV